MLGVRANTVIGTAFIISAFLAAIVSLLFLCQVGVISFHMGTQLMLIAFIATVIGGMGSLVGAVVGGYAIGIVGTLLQVLLPENVRTFRDAFVFAAVIIILLARPQGLVITRAARERV
jgi:branched-chain amino acid transport system permease protein